MKRDYSASKKLPHRCAGEYYHTRAPRYVLVGDISHRAQVRKLIGRMLKDRTRCTPPDMRCSHSTAVLKALSKTDACTTFAIDVAGRGGFITPFWSGLAGVPEIQR